MKKICKFLVLTIIAMLIVTACSGTQDEIFDLSFTSGADGTIDLEGFTMKYAVTPSTLYGDTDAENVLGFEVGTLFSDAAMERMKEIQNNFNCTIDAFYQTDGASIDIFNNSSLGGIYYCDVMQGTAEQLRKGARAGILCSINTLSDYIDYTDSEKWGTAQMLESMCYNGDLYGVLPAAWPELNYTSFGYTFVANMNLAASVGIPDLRETVENNEWTWAKFEETLVAGTVQEGGSTKIYGMVCHPEYLGEMIVRSNGDTLITKTENGEYICGYYDDHAMKALEEFRNIWKGDYAYCFNKSVDSPNDCVVNFIEGNAILTVCDTEHVYGYNGQISKNVEEFAILPAPTGPDVDPSYRFSVHESMRSMITISVLSKSAEASATIVNALYEPFEDYETKQSIIDFMSYNYFFDTRDAEVFFSMFENTSFNYFLVGMRNIVGDLIDTSQTITSILQSRESTFDGYIEEQVIPARETMEILWPQE